MPDDKYEDDQDLMEMDFSGLGLGREDGVPRSARNQSNPGTGKNIMLFLGAFMVIVLVILGMALLTGNRSSEKPISILHARVMALEGKAAHLPEMETLVSTLQEQLQALQASVSKLKQSAQSEEKKLDKLSQQVTRLNNRLGITPAVIKGTASIRKELIRENRPRFHVVSPGESLSFIAKKYGISLQELYTLNGLTSKSIIHPGQKVAVSPEGSE